LPLLVLSPCRAALGHEIIETTSTTIVRLIPQMSSFTSLTSKHKKRGFVMIIRVVKYHALRGKDVEKWMETSASELRGVKGVRRVEFFRSQSDPSQYGAIMLFRNKADLDNYKEEQAGTYQNLVRSVRETWCDTSKPVTEQIYEILDI
jgi:hypothetical protein